MAASGKLVSRQRNTTSPSSEARRVRTISGHTNKEYNRSGRQTLKAISYPATIVGVENCAEVYKRLDILPAYASASIRLVPNVSNILSQDGSRIESDLLSR